MREDKGFFKCLSTFEDFVVMSLILMMAAMLLLATVDLGWIILKDIITPPIIILDIEELLDIFGLFLLVLIGLELLDTIKTYMLEHVMRVRVVFTVALIALARKIIILDVKKTPSLTLLGIAATILALSVGYFFVNRGERHGKVEKQENDTTAT